MNSPTCLFVDELLGEQQVVVKPLQLPKQLQHQAQRHRGVHDSGDGNISIILDVANLYSPFR